MSGLRVKETMEQIHIPEEMREQIILNVRDRMKAGTAGGDGTGQAETAGGAKTGNRRAYSAHTAPGGERQPWRHLRWRQALRPFRCRLWFKIW